MKRLAMVAALGLVAGCDLGGVLTVDDPQGGEDSAVEEKEPRDPTDPVDDEDLVDVVDEKEIDVTRVTLHRLNRAEYNNTVRDLLGDDTRPADNFPEDDFGYGFNNIADVLSLSPLHVEMYASTAELLIDRALEGGPIDATTERFEAEEVGSQAGSASGTEWNLTTNGAIEAVYNFPAEGDYTLRVSARQTQGGPDDALMSLTIDGTPAETFTVAETSLTEFEVTTQVGEGGHVVGVTFENDYYDPDAGEDRNLLVDWFEVEGPLGAVGEPSETRAEIITCDPETLGATECATEVVSAFGLRAWRRPLTDDEITRLVAFIDLADAEGEEFETGIRLALQAILVSPNFIFRVEIDPDPSSDEPHLLSPYELASRMSYFLWSSMPDDELLQAAADGKLSREDGLRQEVYRMLGDPRSAALVDNFATQWLYIDVIDDTDPDYQLYPTFDEPLREAMRAETRLLIAELIKNNAPVTDLLLADYTYMNARLAEHYEVSDGPATANLEKTALEGEARRGLLGHGGLLTSLSFPTRTSPVKRGAWVLGNLLCSEPPAPPPGVENLPTEEGGGKTLREQMEAHSEDPACAGCHQSMDPIGFGMENYDAIGAWRDIDNGVPVDSSGELPDGSSFNGAYELAGILANHPAYAHCVTEKMLTYALGRGVKHYDRPQILTLIEELGDEFGFRDLINEIVLSPAFRMRRGGELPPTN